MSAQHTLSPRQVEILRHSLGLNRDDSRFAYRNHFVTGPGSSDWNDCERLVAAALMTKRQGNAITGGDYVFQCTEAGVAIARASVAKAMGGAP